MDKKGKNEPKTRVEEEIRVSETATSEGGENPELISLPDADNVREDEEQMFLDFAYDQAWADLYALPSIIVVMISEKPQKNLHLEIGVNVSQEFPWKKISCSDIKEYLMDEVENGQEMRAIFHDVHPDRTFLIGYAPVLTQHLEELPEGDPFVLYFSPEDIATATAIIKQIETYERWALNRRLVKKPQSWNSLGSESAVELSVQKKVPPDVYVEVQSAYPTKKPKEMHMRDTSDPVYGYVELLPGEVKYENIVRRRVDAIIQSSPELITLEQQTEPTFPLNAASQYLYEIKADEDPGLDEESPEEVENDPKEAKKTTPNQGDRSSADKHKGPKAPLKISDQVKSLLTILEFNQVDMYRNDYPHISSNQVQRFTNPYVEERLCFADICKSFKRFVCGSACYPDRSGLIVVSYAFTTPAINISVNEAPVDTVQRTILKANPILMWSFDDSLNSKLEFETPIEITKLSFCPYDANILIGGAMTGQIMIWDLRDRVKSLDKEEVLTAAQVGFRETISEFLKWTIRINENTVLAPTAVSALDTMQKGPITKIDWMAKNFSINVSGNVYLDLKDPDNRLFITTSLDGSIAFWNLNAKGDKKMQAAMTSRKRRNLPPELIKSESPYKKLNKLFKPIYMCEYPEPLTSIICDSGNFQYISMPDKPGEDEIFPIEVIGLGPGSVRKRIISSSFFARLHELKWEGYDPMGVAAVNKENFVQLYSFARVHNGPILAMEKNPFYPEIFATIGRTILAIWNQDFRKTPILWRQLSTDLTSFIWSRDRPSVFFLTNAEGCFEAWDLLSKDNAACLSEMIGGGIITTLTDHIPTEPRKVIGIGDYNSSFRIVALPKSFYIPVPDELELFKAFIAKELYRKTSIQNWEQEWRVKNADIIEAKKQAEIEAKMEMDRLKEQEAAKKLEREAAEAKKLARERAAIKPLSYTEKVQKRWDEIYMRRLVKILMSRKRVDEEKLRIETRIEKTRLAYEEAKKKAIKDSIREGRKEVAQVRARILPAEKVDYKRSDMIFAEMQELLTTIPSFDEVEKELNAVMIEQEEEISVDYLTFLERGTTRRDLLNKSVGGNTERLNQYKILKDQDMLQDFDFGCEWFFEPVNEEEEEGEEEEVNEEALGVYKGLDRIPVKDAV